MLKTQKVLWWRTGSANTEGKLGKEPDGEMGSVQSSFIISLGTGHEMTFVMFLACLFHAGVYDVKRWVLLI